MITLYLFIVLINTACYTSQVTEEEDYEGYLNEPPLIGEDSLFTQETEEEENRRNNHDDEANSQILHKRRNHANNALHAKAYQDYLSGDGNETVTLRPIRCNNYRDFYRLLYKICNHSILCRELYYIDGPSMYKASFERFANQLSVAQLFILYNHHNTATNKSSINMATQPYILQDMWPVEWNPRYLIVLKALNDTSAHCHTSIDLLASENIPFVHLSLHLLHIFKTFVNKHTCPHANERLLFDSQKRAHCVCITGKLCGAQRNYTIVIIILLVGVILIGVLLAIGVFISMSKTVKKMDAINMGKKKIQ